MDFLISANKIYTMAMKEFYIVDGYRTPFTKFNTDLGDEPVHLLGVSPSKHLFLKTGVDPNEVDEVIFGCCNQPGNTLGNVSRLIGLRSGVPEEVPAVTVHRNCASGFEAITYAYDKAQAGKGDVFLVGGVESMTQAPFLFRKEAVQKFTKLARSKSLISKVSNACSFRPSDFSPEVSLKLALIDSSCDMSMGATAELLAREYNITREQQDEYAEASHVKASNAQARLDEEIAPYYRTNDNCIRSHSGKIIATDNGIRADISASKLSKLRTIFDRNGAITAGNASQVTDGGAALLLMTEEGLRRTGCTPLAKISDYAYVGCDPKRMGLGPVKAIEKLAGDPWKADLIEINEAFAAQAIACQDLLNIPSEKLNVNGGAIALGHPLAATGARLAITATKELHRRGGKEAIVSLCVGGGQGGAIWITKC